MVFILHNKGTFIYMEIFQSHLLLNFKQHSLLPTGPCGMDIVVGALVGGCFKFPEGTELVSAVYAVSFSKDILQPVQIGIQH